MNRFAKLHPIVQLVFFSVSVIVPLSFNNPFISAISLLGALLFSFSLHGVKAFKTLGFSVAVIAFIGLFNMLFAHYGADVIFTAGEIRFTLEALFYGFNQGAVLAAVLIWFTEGGRCIDSERIIYLFRFAPKTALLFSMTLGLIPRLITKHSDIRDAHLALNGGKSGQGIKAKLSASLDNFSALATYALEGSIITADSMTARGYNPKAVRHSRFRLRAEDIILLAVICILTAEAVIQKIIGNLSFVFEPKIYYLRLSIPALVSFLILELIPSVTELQENMRWKLSNVKA